MANIPTTPPPPAYSENDTMSPGLTPLATPEPVEGEESPLYYEINIPLPRIPTAYNHSQSTLPTQQKQNCRHRAHTLASLSPFHHRRPSSPSKEKLRKSEELVNTRWEHPQSIKPGEIGVEGMMNSLKQATRKRGNTVDALAVVPTVLVLGAELFTPNEEDANPIENDKPGKKG